MASSNTTTVTDRFIEITFDESGSSGVDWHSGSTAVGKNGLGLADDERLAITSLVFIPSGSNDFIFVRDSSGGTSSGALIWYHKAAAITGDHSITFDTPLLARPAVDVSDCSFTGTSGTAKLLIHLA
jgi:hypothetical protein